MFKTQKGEIKIKKKSNVREIWYMGVFNVAYYNPGASRRFEFIIRRNEIFSIVHLVLLLTEVTISLRINGGCSRGSFPHT